MQFDRRETLHDTNQIKLRSATADDFPELFHLTLVGLGPTDLAERLTETDVHPFHQHLLDHGRIIVTELGGTVKGYCSVVERDETRFLSQLFVHPDVRSLGIGAMLLGELDRQVDLARGLIASEDLRGVSLYIRHGYVPSWPLFTIELSEEVVAEMRPSTLESAGAEAGPELEQWDKSVGGRSRSVDFSYWLRAAGGKPFWFTSSNEIVGYGWIMDPLAGALNHWYEGGAPLHIGPVGAASSEHAGEVVLAALDIVRRAYPGRGASIEIGGPHPALPELLTAGARIVNAETTMFSDAGRFGCPERYVPSGGVLF